MTAIQNLQTSPATDPNALRGKRAVVTGGTIGMGLAIVRALTDRGAEVLYTGRSEQRLADAQAALNTPLAHPVRADATDMADLAALAGRAEAILGGIDYLFVNQGIAEFQTLEEVTEESWDRISTSTRRVPSSPSSTWRRSSPRAAPSSSPRSRTTRSSRA